MKTVFLPNSFVHTGSLILVNGQNPYFPDKTAHTLVAVSDDNPDILMERRAVVLLSNLMEEIQGWPLICAVSGWRSVEEQQNIREQSLRKNGPAFTRSYVAEPGHSEHHTGLAVDLGIRQAEMDFIRPEFPDSGICRTFREKAASYGFIERYPEGKEDITGIAHEPWHFRYVGVPHAAVMTEKDLTLEEYLALIRQYPCGARSYPYRTGNLLMEISFLPVSKDSGTQRIELDAQTLYSVSGNNTDGFILTKWRELESSGA